VPGQQGYTQQQRFWWVLDGAVTEVRRPCLTSVQLRRGTRQQTLNSRGISIAQHRMGFRIIMTDQRAPVFSHWKSLLDTIATLALIAASGTLVWSTLSARPAAPAANGSERSNRPEPSLPADPISLAGAVRRGSEAARVAVVMYSDFRCPYCKRFALETLP
jgi:hypothetical protein